MEALARKRVKRIILARPAVEAGESLGFLPGDLQAKVDPYLRPLYDALEDMMPHDRVQRALETRTIEIAPLAYMRGRTLSDAFIILDEAQNATGAQMKMFLTRLGVNSRTVVTGDKTQIDLPTREDSGPDPGGADPARHRRDRVLLPDRGRRRAAPAGAGDHPGLRGGPERLMSGQWWMIRAQALEGLTAGQRAWFHLVRWLPLVAVALFTTLVFPGTGSSDIPEWAAGTRGGARRWWRRSDGVFWETFDRGRGPRRPPPAR